MSYSSRSPPYFEPVAVVGMSCRLPGRVTSTSRFWDLLIEGRSGHCEMPKSRFNVDGFYHQNADHRGSVNATGGYFIQEDIHRFDNAFFGINNLEAKYMDPQQRQLLEVVFECFESAGAMLHDLPGANVGCYIANFTTDYNTMQAKDPDSYHRYSATGFGTTILANRISHVFNLKGPSVVLDTACSSSLYALHIACTALNAGDCDAAIVAGANLVQSPELHLAMVKAGVLSSTSTCHTFDATADGYGRGEGVGALYLKRLSTAIHDIDPIRSVVQGTAVNSNGHTLGITLPSVAGQEAVIRKAYSQGGLATDQTTYVEAHGTGTPVGDPVEIEALSRVLRLKTGRPTSIGSVKTNLGHSEAVSGISSIIKVTLALEHGFIPPTIGIKNLNLELKLTERNIEVVTKLRPWPEGTIPRASINSFGYGGANAHAIIEAASVHVPEDHERTSKSKPNHTFILPLSAHSLQSLTDRITAVVTYGINSDNLPDLAYTLGCRRSRLLTSGYFLANGKNLDNDLLQSNFRTVSIDSPSLPFAFIFTGQGAQWPRMGFELMSRFPTYRAAIRGLDTCLACLPLPPHWTIEEAILASAETSEIHKASHSQPVCTAVQIALVELLKDWNIAPRAVIGHSSGEICAAYTAGYLTAHEAISVAYYRGLAVSGISAKGAMIAVGLGHEKAAMLISNLGLRDKICVACINSAESTTISGDSSAIDELLAALRSKEIFARKLKTDDKAYHSHLMKSVGQRYEDLLSPIFAKRTWDHLISGDAWERDDKLAVEMFSSVMGQLAGSDIVSSARYWRDNLESPVLFSGTLEKLLLSQAYHSIEIGPHPTLGQPLRDTQARLQLEENQTMYTRTLSREQDSEKSMLDLAGKLYLCGHILPFGKINFPSSASEQSIESRFRGRVMHSLPTYPWHYDAPLWNESRISSEFRNRKYKHHDLLGSRIFGGPGKPAMWRIVLKANEVHWLRDHKLGETIVFPAAGYLAMAIEGLRQMQQIDYSLYSSILFRRVHLTNILVIPDDKDGIEIFMTAEPAKLSSVTSSNIWWHFEISSIAADRSTIHANGLISSNCTPSAMSQKHHILGSIMEQQSVRTWYAKLAKEGLRFGPTFQSLTEIQTHRGRTLPYAISKTVLRQGGGYVHDQQSEYFIHPITIDSLLQTAIIASAAGTVQNLHGKVPVSIGRLEIQREGPANSTALCTIRASSEKVGFGTVILNAELESTTGKIIARMEDIRAVAYAGTRLQSDSTAERNPALRVLWKPDISRVSTDHTEALTRYIDRFASFLPKKLAGKPDLGRFAGALDLITHQNPRMHILEVGNGVDSRLGELLDLISIGTPPKRFESYTQASMDGNGGLLGYSIQTNAKSTSEATEASRLRSASVFDAVIILPPVCGNDFLNTHMKDLSRFLAPNAVLLFATSSQAAMPLHLESLSVSSAIPNGSTDTLTVARILSGERPRLITNESKIILVNASEVHDFNKTLRVNLSQAFGHDVESVPVIGISAIDIPPQSIVITTIELEEPVLANMTDAELQAVKTMANNASVLLWITGAALFKARRPLFALVLGLSRSLMLERPALKMPVLDLDNTTDDVEISCKNVISVLHQVLHRAKPDFEYRQHNGVLFNSRFVPDISINKRFRQAQNADKISMPVKEAGHCRLAMKSIGHIDTIHFEQQPQSDLQLPPQYLEVKVKAVGLNAKDFYALSSKVDTKASTCALEFSGIVTRSSSTESRFTPGDRVVVMAPSHFATYECVPEWTCCKMQDEEDFATMSTIPLVFSTALYALEYRANLQPGESILIHSAAGGLGIAAIQIARRIGAEIFATVGTAEKKQFLVENFELRADHIFSSRESSFLPGILAATSDRGVDVLLNSLTGDLLHDSWLACAHDGRFVEVGKRDISDSGMLGMHVFGRGVTFTAFDLTSLYWSPLKSKHDIWYRLLERSVQMLRDGEIAAIKPLKTFSSSEVVQAFRYFSQATRIGKVAVSFEEQESQVQVVPVKYRTTFDSSKAYLMIGCLGGLGRSLSRWMLLRGARNFAFIGRSGADKSSARDLVHDLQAAGASVVVIRGDVTLSSDVERAIAEASRPIGGVIHAAMGIHVALFTDMQCATWHLGINQKVKGAWNLHHALQGKDGQLDFFLMLSSITGSIGTATESNYCAANSFLDAFACHRRSLGLPATSLGLGMISEVGFLHENPEIEAVLLRKGVHPFTEAELLQMIDISISPPAVDPLAMIDESFGADHYMQDHILTGLELHGFQKIRDDGFKRPTQVLEDPRCAVIAGAFANSSNTDSGGPADGGNNNHLPRAVSAALVSNEGNAFPDETLVAAVQGVVTERIGTLLLVPLTQLRSNTQLMDFGMESMLAAEFRSDMFRAFKVDVPFAVLLNNNTSVGVLAELVARELLVMKREQKTQAQ